MCFGVFFNIKNKAFRFQSHNNLCLKGDIFIYLFFKFEYALRDEERTVLMTSFRFGLGEWTVETLFYSVCLSVCLCLPVCVSVCLSPSLSRCACVCVCVCARAGACVCVCPRAHTRVCVKITNSVLLLD